MPSDRANWFIALPVSAGQLPPDATRELPSGTRTLHPDDLHVTVAFLGAVGETRALRAWSALEPPAGPPVSARIGPRATFGNPRRPSALGLDLEPRRGHGELARVIEARRNPLREAAGVEPEVRAVRPHVTLGRPPRRPSTAWWRACEQWLAAADPPASLRFDRIALYTRADGDPERGFRMLRTLHWRHPADGRDGSP